MDTADCGWNEVMDNQSVDVPAYVTSITSGTMSTTNTSNISINSGGAMSQTISCTPSLLINGEMPSMSSATIPPGPTSTRATLPPVLSVKQEVTESALATTGTAGVSEFNPNNPNERTQMVAIMEYFKAKKMLSVVDAMKGELGIAGSDQLHASGDAIILDGSSIGHIPAEPASVVRAEGNVYICAYEEYQHFVEHTLEMYQAELGTIYYPLFVYMYMDLINQGSLQDAATFCSKYMTGLDTCYSEYLRILSSLRRKEFLAKWEYLEVFRGNNYTVSLCADAFNYLKRYVHDSNYHGIIRNIMFDRLRIDTYDGTPRSENQIAAARGAMTGDALKVINKCRVYYGLIKEPDIDVPIYDDDDEDGKQKKKRARRDLNKKSKPDPNAPPVTRIPLPELRHIDKLLIMHARREAKKRISVGADRLPSICFYSILNASEQALCVQVSDDVALLAVGFADSYIKLYSLTPEKLRVMKGVDELSMIDKECDDIFRRMMEDSKSMCQTLAGHQGAVYGLSFSPDMAYLLSCSCDTSIRLWSLNTFTCLVSYTSHIHPVLDVCFSPHGYYFLSCSRDKTARLWVTDHYQCVRMFVGHFSAVLCCAYHPNSNYVATGSADRSVRVWDVLTGGCVRHFTGHKQAVSCLRFHTEGRYLVSAGTDSTVLVWDLDGASLVAACSHHTPSTAVSTLAFSRDGTLLVSGGMDYQICVWDMLGMVKVYTGGAVTGAGTSTSGSGSATTTTSTTASGEMQHITQPLKAFRTKQSSLLLTYFTRRNLMLAFGKFDTSPSQ